MASHPRRRRLSDPGATAAAPATSGLHEAAALAAVASTLHGHHQHETASVHASDASFPAIAAAIAAAHARRGDDRTVAALGPASHRLRWGMSRGGGAEEAAASTTSPRAGGREKKRAGSPAAGGERAGPPPTEPPSAAAATRPMSAARLIQLQRSTTPITIGKASHHQQVLTAATPRTTAGATAASGSKEARPLYDGSPRRGDAKSPGAAGSGSASQRRKGSAGASSPRKSPLRVHPAIPAPNAVRSSALEAAVRDSYFPCVRRTARLWGIDQAAMRAVHLGALRDALVPENSSSSSGSGGSGEGVASSGAGGRGWVESRVAALSARELRAVAEGPDPSALYEADASLRDGQPQHRYAASDAPKAGADLVLVRRLRTRELVTGRLLPVTGGEGLVGGGTAGTAATPLLPSAGQGFKGIWAVAPFPAPARRKREEGEAGEVTAATAAAAASAAVPGLPALFAMRLTPTLLLRRDGLRFHPRLVATSHRAWKLARRYSLKARTQSLDQETYVAFFARVAAARRDVLGAPLPAASRRGGEAGAPPTPSNATAADVSAVKAAWVVDSCGLGSLPFGLFQIAWFLAADTTPGLEPEVQAYAAVLEGILGVMDPKGATRGPARARPAAALPAGRPRAGSAPPALGGGASFRRHKSAKASASSTLSLMYRDASAPLQEGAARYLRALPRYWGYVTACAGAGGSGGSRALTAASVRAALCRTELRPHDKGSPAVAQHHVAAPDERRTEEVEALAPALLRPAVAPPPMLGVAAYKEAVAAAAAAAAVAKIGARGLGRPTSAAAIAAAAAAAAAVTKQLHPDAAGAAAAGDAAVVGAPPASSVPIAFAPVIAPAPIVIPPVITKSVDARGGGGGGIIMAAPLRFQADAGGGGGLAVPVVEAGGGSYGPRGVLGAGLYGSLEAEALVVEGEEPGMWGDIELSYALPTSSRPSVLLTPAPSVMLVGGAGSTSGSGSLIVGATGGESAVAACGVTSASSSLLLSDSGVHLQPSESLEQGAAAAVPPAPAAECSASPTASPPPSPPPAPAAAPAAASPASSATRSAVASPASPPSPPSPGARSSGASPSGSVHARSRSGSPVPQLMIIGGGGGIGDEEPTVGGGSSPPASPAGRTRSSSAVIDLNLQFAPPQQALFTKPQPPASPPASPPSPPQASAEPAFQAPVLLAPGESLEELPLHHYHGKGSPTSTASPGMLAPALMYESPGAQFAGGSGSGEDGVPFPVPAAAAGGGVAGKPDTVVMLVKQPLPIILEARDAEASAAGTQAGGVAALVAGEPDSDRWAETAAVAPDAAAELPQDYGYGLDGGNLELLQQQGFEDAGYHNLDHYYNQGQPQQYQGGYIPATLMVPAGVPDVQLSAQPSLAGAPHGGLSRPSSRGRPAAFGLTAPPAAAAAGPPPVQHIGPLQRRINDPVPSLAAQMMAALTKETQRIEKRSVGGGGGSNSASKGRGGGGSSSGGVTDALPGPSPQRSADGHSGEGGESGSGHPASRSASPQPPGHRDSLDFAGIEGSESMGGSQTLDGPYSPLMPAGAGFSALSLKGLDDMDSGGGAGAGHLLLASEGGHEAPESSAAASDDAATRALVSRVARAGSAEFQRLGDGVPTWKRTGLLPTGKAAPSPVLRKGRPASAGGVASGSGAAGAGGLAGGGRGTRPRPLSAFPRHHRDGDEEKEDETTTAGGEGATNRDSILFGSLMQSSDGGSDGTPLHGLDGGPSVGMLLFSGGGSAGGDGGPEDDGGDDVDGEDFDAAQQRAEAQYYAKQPSASFDAAEADRDVFSEDGSRFGRVSPQPFSPQPPASPLLMAVPGITLHDASGAYGHGSPTTLLGSPVRLSSAPLPAAGGAAPAAPSYTLYDAWAVYAPAGEAEAGGPAVPAPRVPASATAVPGRHTPSPPPTSAATAGHRLSRSQRGSPASPVLDIGLDHGELDLLAPPVLRRGGSGISSYVPGPTVQTPTIASSGANMPRAAWAGSLAAAANALFPQGPAVLQPLARDMLQQQQQQQQRPGSKSGGRDVSAPASPVFAAPSESKGSASVTAEAFSAAPVAASDTLSPLASGFTRATRVFTLESLLPPDTADGSIIVNASIGHTASAVLAALPSLDAPLPPPAASGRPGTGARLRGLSTGSGGASSRPTSAGRRPASATRGARPTTPSSFGRVLLSLEEHGPTGARPRSGAGGRAPPAASSPRPRSASRGGGNGSGTMAGGVDASASRFPATVPRPGSPPGALRSPRPGSASGRASRSAGGGAGRATHDRVDAYLAQQQQEQLQLNLVQSNNLHRPGTAGTTGGGLTSPPRPTSPRNADRAAKPAGIVSSRGYRATVETAPSLASTYVRWAKALKPEALAAAPPPDKGLTLSKSPLRGGGAASAPAARPTLALGSSAPPGLSFGRAGTAFSGTDGDDWVLSGGGGATGAASSAAASSAPEGQRPTTPGRRGGSSPTKAGARAAAAAGGRLSIGSSHRPAGSAGSMLPPTPRRMPAPAAPEGLAVLTATPSRGAATPSARAGSGTPRSPSPTRTPRLSLGAGAGGLVPPPSPLAAAGARSLLRPSSAVGTPGGTGGLLLGRGSASVTSGGVGASGKPPGGPSGFGGTGSGGAAATTPRSQASYGTLTQGTARSVFT